ncbi:urokinase plasminogen activator surface receptor-like [Kryptolebias marmoratus]|uniref:Urokinase plasminogen activator surface receptor-like n=1 Tax=Kryptolebias marmoratus TaxID=37003 RepID=A0A3Q3FZ14_KRYMA|nr:urokinase plasminogen activator surface receptor-like [Kryptolebias marmoratus]
MFFVTLILGVWLLPKANSLECHECLPGVYGNCNATTTKTTTCASENNLCAATRFTMFLGSFKLVDVKTKKCALAQECVQGSINFGVGRIVTNTMCCNRSRCNDQDVPEATSLSENGRRCLSCEGRECGRTLNCEKNEDYCIKSTMTKDEQKLTMKGCASKLLCLNNTIAEIKQLTGAEISCCHGDYCNSASSISAELLLLLLLPLLSLILF